MLRYGITTQLCIAVSDNFTGDITIALSCPTITGTYDGPLEIDKSFIKSCGVQSLVDLAIETSRTDHPLGKESPGFDRSNLDASPSSVIITVAIRSSLYAFRL